MVRSREFHNPALAYLNSRHGLGLKPEMGRHPKSSFNLYQTGNIVGIENREENRKYFEGLMNGTIPLGQYDDSVTEVETWIRPYEIVCADEVAAITLHNQLS